MIGFPVMCSSGLPVLQCFSRQVCICLRFCNFSSSYISTGWLDWVCCSHWSAHSNRKVHVSTKISTGRLDWACRSHWSARSNGKCMWAPKSTERIGVSACRRAGSVLRWLLSTVVKCGQEGSGGNWFHGPWKDMFSLCTGSDETPATFK